MCVQLLYTFPIDNFYKIADQMIDFDCTREISIHLNLKLVQCNVLQNFL